MRLLVSLRSADEVAAAVAGGADILDAKEPAAGSLGAVSPAVLEDIAALVSPGTPLSIALGDFTAPDAARSAVAGVKLPARAAPTWLKLGFAGERRPAAVLAIVAAAVEAARRSPLRPGIVPVAYADHGRAGSAPVDSVLAAAIAGGASGFLIDTWAKDGRTLFEWLALGSLRAWSIEARSAGLLFAVAGSLAPPALEALAAIADVIGVRGAACRGGRLGTVDAELVRRLRDRLAPPSPLSQSPGAWQNARPRGSTDMVREGWRRK